jgi:hypothetical protein
MCHLEPPIGPVGWVEQSSGTGTTMPFAASYTPLLARFDPTTGHDKGDMVQSCLEIRDTVVFRRLRAEVALAAENQGRLVTVVLCLCCPH